VDPARTETTANKLIPAIDMGQSLFVPSGDGELSMIPAMPAALPRRRLAS